MDERAGCLAARETVSAGWDGEPGPLTEALAAEHVAGCRGCDAWARSAGAVSRGLRVRPTDEVPDLSAAITEAAAAQGLAAPSARVQRQGPGWWWGLFGWRVALAVIAVAQLGLGVSQLFGFGASGHAGHMGMPVDDHLFNESSAWNVAIGAGFAAAAMLPRLAAGVLPMLQVFLLVLIGVSLMDLIGGQASIGRVASHGLVLVGVFVLWRVNASYRRFPRPGQRSGDGVAELFEMKSIRGVGQPLSAEEGDARQGRWLRPAGRKAA